MSTVCGGETACLRRNFNFRYYYYFSLTDDVISTFYHVHISGKVLVLVSIPGYFVDGYTRYPGFVFMAVPNVPKA